jgi:hypothetical protein
MIPPIESTDKNQTLHFPSAGIDLSTAFSRQKPRQILGRQGGVQQQPVTGQPIVGGYDIQAVPDPVMWASSTPSGINCRGFDPAQNRRRGGSRSGLKPYLPVPVNGPWVVQCLAAVIDVPP